MTTAIPTTVTATSTGFTPAFNHVCTTDRHADSLACIAIIASTTIEDVFEKAEQLGLPKTGPYNHMLDIDFLAKLLAKYQLVATVWKEFTDLAQLPDLCMALVDYDAAWEVGRFVIIHKAKASHDGKVIMYAIDPSTSEAELQVRTDLDALAPAWFIGVHAMGKTAATSAKK